jgi:hypothetical protein
LDVGPERIAFTVGQVSDSVNVRVQGRTGFLGKIALRSVE